MRIIDDFVWWAANRSPADFALIMFIAFIVIYGLFKLPVPEKKIYRKRT